MKITLTSQSTNFESAIADFFQSANHQLTTAQRGVYCHLLCMAFQNPEHELNSTIKKLATEMRVHPSTLSRYLHILEAAGLLDLSRPRRERKPAVDIADVKMDATDAVNVADGINVADVKMDSPSKKMTKGRRKLTRRQRKLAKARELSQNNCNQRQKK